MGVVNSIGPLYAPPAYGINGGLSSPYNPGGVSTYSQILALQAENDLLEIGATSSASGSSASGASLLSADLLDLSPAALNILNGIENAESATGITGTATLLSVSSGSGASSLTPAQQQQAATIVAQFANAPLTQATFTQIENALVTAGINPQQISIEQLLSGYVFAFGSPDLSGQLTADTLADELTAA